MRPIAKFVVLGCLLIGAGIGAAAMLAPREEKSVEACQNTTSKAQAPGGAYKYELVVNTCGWGFGQAAETVDIKVSKLGANGWFMHLPIEYDSTAEDQGTAIPTAEWTTPQELAITVHSKSRTGTIVSKHQGLTVTRTYLTPSACLPPNLSPGRLTGHSSGRLTAPLSFIVSNHGLVLVEITQRLTDSS